MAPIAAVMTGPGAGAIATIQVCGDSAETILRDIFRRPGGKPSDFAAGQILLGDIIDGQQRIDQVMVGCESPNVFAIHCHGNPLIVERIMELLAQNGVQPVSAGQMLARTLASREAGDSIAIEAKLALTTVKTIEGAILITNQVKAGLAEKAKQWQAKLDSTPLEQIAAEAKQILHDSEAARLILSGCTIALIGPPNSGKSTLLNALAGREKAIVTDIRGTTRDWVTAEIRIPPLLATIIDTAGLDPTLGAAGDIDQTAQQKSIEAISRADLVLLVLDASQPVDPLPGSIADHLIDRRTITVLNKADLPPQLDLKSLPEHLRYAAHISAKLEAGIEDLIRAIHEALDVTGPSSDASLAFTDRQRVFVEQLSVARSKRETVAILAELLHSKHWSSGQTSGGATTR